MNDHNEVAGAAGLPHGSEVQRVGFVAESGPGQPVLLEFREPIRRNAVLLGHGAAASGKQPGPAADLLLLSVAAPDHEELSLLNKMRDWVDAGAPEGERTGQMLTLQGAQIFWAPGRVALLTPADRFDSVRKALIEFSYYEAELRGLERELNELWPHLDADAPLAFEFDEKSVRKRQVLSQRFRQVLSIRARLARITPHVLCPHVHPPTLASQIGERLRERTRLAARVEFVEGQVEVFERVYELCGQRASDFMLTRTSNTLEWVIIVLLLTQTILVGIDLLVVRK